MGEKKVFCRRAEELKSIDELELPEETTKYLKGLGKTVGEILAAFRCDGYEYFSDEYLFSGVDSSVNDGHDEDSLREIATTVAEKFEEMGFVRNDLKTPNFILDEILGEDTLQCTWADEFLYTNNDYAAFNKKYEEYSFSVDRVLEIIQDGLTEGQFKIAKFEIEHVALLKPFRFSDVEESFRAAARKNIKRLFKDDIRGALLS